MSQKISVDLSMGTPNILSLYCNAAIISSEFFIAVNSDPNIDFSTPIYFLMCHIIWDLSQNIIIPVIDLLVVLYPVWLKSTKHWVDTDLHPDLGISKGIGSQASGYKSAQSNFWNLSSDIIGYFGSKHSLSLGTCLRHPNTM